MVVFSFRAGLETGQDWLDWGLRDLHVRSDGDGHGDGGAVLYAMSGPGGGLGGWRLETGTAADLTGFRPFSAGESQSATGRFLDMTTAGTGGGLVIGSDANRLVGLETGETGETGGGGVGPALYWPGTGAGNWTGAGPVTALAATATGLVYLTHAGGAIRGYQLNGEGALAPLAGVAADSGAVVDLDMATVGAQGFLLATDAEGCGVASYRVDPVTGALNLRGQMGAGQGLGVMHPVGLEVATVGGGTFAVLASGGNGQSGALSVLELQEDGYLQPVDHILDNRVTRFGQVQDLAVVTAEDRAYVLASGGDDGLSLFVLIATGRLVHLQSLAEGALPGVFGADHLAALRTGDEIQIFLAAADRAGVAQLSLSIADRGGTYRGTSANDVLQGGAGDDILIGGAGADDLAGGAGDDILVDGAGQDTLTGGAGADIFILEQDGQRDLVRGFEPGVDRLDLSGFTMLYDPAQLGFVTRSGGADLTWRGEVTEVRSASGQPLTLDDLFGSGFQSPDRPPLGAGERMIGGASADQLGGAWGADSLEGRAGNDLIRGGGGDDRLYGGDGYDTLDGGDGNDQIWGGNGRDRVFLGAGDDVFFDNGQSGDFGRDTVWAGTGHDTIQGGNGDDVFYGMDGNDLIFGRLGADRLFGGAGADTLHGGDGNDSIWGGAGADVFVFAPDDAVDRIGDFTPGEDLIRLTGTGGGFAGLEISSGAGGLWVRAEGNTLWLEGVAAGALGAEDFLFA